jgi:hypothetical protein
MNVIIKLSMNHLISGFYCTSYVFIYLTVVYLTKIDHV